MGVDLSLLPFDNANFSHTVLDCERRRALFEEIADLPATPVPQPFYTFRSRADHRDSHYGDTQETPYGEPLTAVQAQHLLPFAQHPGVCNDARNRAVWAYLACLPPETQIALFWH